MKVMWLCNGPITKIAQHLGQVSGIGWIDGAYFNIKACASIDIVLCFPMAGAKKVNHDIVDGIEYFAIPASPFEPHVYWDKYEVYLAEVFEETNPDIIHIWGTEFPHSLAMTKVADNKKKVVINIQGLCSIYSKHYFANMPYNIVKSKTFRDIIRHDSIRQQQKKYENRGINEKKAIQMAGYVIGRTDWDQACTYDINPNVEYLHCYETLRNGFYSHKWEFSKCQQHSIFISQSNYPIKGFHNFLMVMPSLLKDFPDLVVYTTGVSPFEKKIWKIDGYSKYICDLITRLHLKDHIKYLGRLNEQEMIKQYLNSNIAVLSSSIENSPNSLGEAMLLGMPTVSADVGGVNSFIEHKKNGYLYQSDAPYMLAYYIREIFNNPQISIKIGNRARNKALTIFNKEKNAEQLATIYNHIIDK